MDSIRRRMIRSAKNKPCADCGRRYPYYVMQFDHLPQFEKLFDLSRWQEHSREEIRAEIAKCQVVCANCHAIRTHKRCDGEDIGEPMPSAQFITITAESLI